MSLKGASLLFAFVALVFAQCEPGVVGSIPCACDDVFNCTDSLFSQDSCVYRVDDGVNHLVGCIYLKPYDCDGYWAMDVGMFDEEINTQIIRYPQVIPGDETTYNICYNDTKLGNTCQQCFTFPNIKFSGAEIHSPMNYTYTCGENLLMAVSFEEVSGISPRCGEEGYFYPPCSFSLDSERYSTKMQQTVRSGPGLYVNDNSTSKNYGCVMTEIQSVNPEEGNQIYPIYCPFIEFDTCSRQAKITTFQGYDFTLDIVASTNSVEDCIEAKDSVETLCVKATDIIMRGNSISLQLVLNSYMGGFLLEDLSLGMYHEVYPSCGDSETQCGEYYYSYDEGRSNSGESSASSMEEIENGSGSGPWLSGLDLLLICGTIACFILILVLIVIIVALIIHRQKVQVPQLQVLEMDD